jgi:hypothetical protein
MSATPSFGRLQLRLKPPTIPPSALRSGVKTPEGSSRQSTGFHSLSRPPGAPPIASDGSRSPSLSRSLSPGLSRSTGSISSRSHGSTGAGGEARRSAGGKLSDKKTMAESNGRSSSVRGSIRVYPPSLHVTSEKRFTVSGLAGGALQGHRRQSFWEKVQVASSAAANVASLQREQARAKAVILSRPTPVPYAAPALPLQPLSSETFHSPTMDRSLATAPNPSASDTWRRVVLGLLMRVLRRLRGC